MMVNLNAQIYGLGSIEGGEWGPSPMGWYFMSLDNSIKILDFICIFCFGVGDFCLFKVCYSVNWGRIWHWGESIKLKLKNEQKQQWIIDIDIFGYISTYKLEMKTSWKTVKLIWLQTPAYIYISAWCLRLTLWVY